MNALVRGCLFLSLLFIAVLYTEKAMMAETLTAQDSRASSAVDARQESQVGKRTRTEVSGCRRSSNKPGKSQKVKAVESTLRGENGGPASKSSRRKPKRPAPAFSRTEIKQFLNGKTMTLHGYDQF